MSQIMLGARRTISAKTAHAARTRLEATALSDAAGEVIKPTPRQAGFNNTAIAKD